MNPDILYFVCAIVAVIIILGAVLGEFFGKIEVGVGLAMILAQQASNGPQVWALALLSGGVALLGFALVGWIAKAIAPWSKGR